MPGIQTRDAEFSSESTGILAPHPDRFAAYPCGWYVFGRSGEVKAKPVSKEMLGGRIVAYRTGEGSVVLMDGRCRHMGADLGKGMVVADRIQCPFHHWEYDAEGRCRKIPAQPHVPAQARQRVYPSVERHGMIFFYNGREPHFPLPFFPGVDADEFVAGRPFVTDLKCPWYLIGANAFDMQHFRAAHDRRLKGAPEVCSPHAFARRATGTFEVAGGSARDRVTRLFAGNEVTMQITDWCGLMMFATATFRRATSYGMVTLVPLGAAGVRVSVTVFTRRRTGFPGAGLMTSAILAIRTYFIREFLREDALLLDTAGYNPHGFVECDQELVDYFRWLSEIPRPDGSFNQCPD